MRVVSRSAEVDSSRLGFGRLRPEVRMDAVARIVRRHRLDRWALVRLRRRYARGPDLCLGLLGATTTSVTVPCHCPAQSWRGIVDVFRTCPWVYPEGRGQPGS